jgi:hypothetical protein
MAKSKNGRPAKAKGMVAVAKVLAEKAVAAAAAKQNARVSTLNLMRMSSLLVKGIKRGKRRRKRRNQRKRRQRGNQEMILPLQLLLLQRRRNLPGRISRTELPNWRP